MSFEKINPGSLVAYRGRAARVLRMGKKIQIELQDGNIARVRPKDITLLHPGPLNSFAELKPQEGDLRLAWEILSASDTGKELSLEDLAILIYNEFSPATSWDAWKHVQDGLYFQGTPEAIRIRSKSEVIAEINSRQEKEQQARAWDDFLQRIRRGAFSFDKDREFLREVEELALGRRKDSRILRYLGRSVRPESAHALLLETGCWDETNNPYPIRFNLSTTAPELEVPDLPNENRLDLTQLQAFAIDDRENRDPDDAISLEEINLDNHGDLVSARLWVHIADVASLVPPDSEIDLEARSRSATLYLPEGQVPMLPSRAIESLGLGLNNVSPALSFGIQVDAQGEISEVRIHPSWVHVQRLSYEQAEDQLESTPLAELWKIASAFRDMRARNGALFLDLPEVILRVENGRVQIHPLKRYRSRDLVREFMLMAGQAAGLYAQKNALPIPYVIQEGTKEGGDQVPPSKHEGVYQDFASAFALRRRLQRSRISLQPGWHASVGLQNYCRATSPLRRYLDLVVHQQIRRHLCGETPLEEGKVLELIGSSEAVIGSISQVEALSRRHWTLVFLQQNPEWEGEAVLVEANDSRGRVIVPDLALEAPIFLTADLSLNSLLQVKVKEVNLPELDVFFEVLSTR